MKITTEKYNTLSLIAGDIATARAAPKEMEKFIKIVIDDEGKDKVVRKFSAEMTRAAILLALIAAVEDGGDYTKIFLGKGLKKKPAEEHDTFTAEALKKIPPGKPDAEKLAMPKTPVITMGDHRAEGHEWQDVNGRYWRIVDGKKRQQKKPKPT